MPVAQEIKIYKFRNRISTPSLDTFFVKTACMLCKAGKLLEILHRMPDEVEDPTATTEIHDVYI